MTKDGTSEDRIVWRNKFEFAFNVIGYNVGIGNIWRFSYLCFKNGGGAFLIPYLLSAALVGMPLIFMETAIGQYTRHGCIAAWDILPLMRGIGFAEIIIPFLCNIYFVVAMSWCVFYFFKSLTSGEFEWATCDNWWNTEKCVPLESSASYNSSMYQNNTKEAITDGVSASKEFYDNYVLQRTSGLEDIGGFSNWKMVGCFVASWIASYMCIYKGIRTSGKAAYVTVTAPYVLLLILFFRGVTLEGAGEGVLFYITPNITKLLEPTVWLDGGTQVIYSLGVCFGCFYGLGSYNKKSFDCYKSAYVFVLTCCGSSIFFGFVVFSFIGHMAHTQGKEISEIADGGPGLVFLVFPSEFNTLPIPQLWAAAFFLSLTLLAIDAVFCTVESLVTALADYWPERFGPKGTHLWRGGLCLVTMLISLPQFADGGIYIFEIINRYGASGVTLLWVAFAEAIAIGWIYGMDRFYEDVKSMIGYYPSKAVKFCLKYITPSFCFIIFIACCVKYKPLEIGNYVYPPWGNAIGWMLTLASVLSIPVVAVYSLLMAPGTLKQRWSLVTSPAAIEEKSFSPENKEEIKIMLNDV